MAKKTPKKKKAEKPSTIVPSQTMIAKHFGVSVRTVNGWINRPDAMPGERGKYDLAEIEKWRDKTFIKGKDQQAVESSIPANESNQTSKKTKTSKEDSLATIFLKEKIRKESALATQNEIKSRKMDDEFIQLEAVNRWVSEFLILQRKLLTAMPIEMFADAPKKIRDIYQPDLKERINIHLNQMGDWIERVEDLKD